ncbi:transposase [Bathymodiolus platifrons methanotrophic gill symbiont]|uniref:transposase n=1 Tax=Bathymodiolus platifrons methanotrophic gill symbiont TaxID=113268 RepID=UPI001C8D810E|nr:transposase [Bathymodiolus platifrons methanotrophic gill symbiont]
MKQVKGRWACLFLDFRFYLPLKTIQGKKETATIRGEVVPFQTKMAQAAQMLIEITEHFSTVPILAVTDSWFGNNGLWKPAYKAIGNRFNLLSRLRCNNVLYDLPEKRKPKQRGRNKKYGQRLGSATDMAKTVQQEARFYNVNLYGKQREVSAYSRVVMLKTLKRGVAIFAKACFGHPSPSKQQKLNATANAFGAPDVLRTCHFATTIVNSVLAS